MLAARLVKALHSESGVLEKKSVYMSHEGVPSNQIDSLHGEIQC